MPGAEMSCGVVSASVLVVDAAQAVEVWSAVCASKAGVAAEEYSAKNQWVGPFAAVEPERKVMLVTRSPACSGIATEVMMPVAPMTTAAELTSVRRMLAWYTLAVVGEPSFRYSSLNAGPRLRVMSCPSCLRRVAAPRVG